MEIKGKKLTTKQQRFVDAYEGNATEAARIAGYSIKRAGEIGYQLLQKTPIVAAIKARQAKESLPIIASRQDRQVMWSKMMSDESLDPKHRLKASELLGRSEGDFIDNLNVHVGLEDKLKAMSDEELQSRLAALQVALGFAVSTEQSHDYRKDGGERSDKLNRLC